MMTPAAPLLPCPFCGMPAELIRMGSRACSSMIRCTYCHGELEANENQFNTGSAWNRRAPAGGENEAEIIALRKEVWDQHYAAKETLVKLGNAESRAAAAEKKLEQLIELAGATEGRILARSK